MRTPVIGCSLRSRRTQTIRARNFREQQILGARIGSTNRLQRPYLVRSRSPLHQKGFDLSGIVLRTLLEFVSSLVFENLAIAIEHDQVGKPRSFLVRRVFVE